VLRQLATHASDDSRTSVFAGLTEREQEILEYAVLGYHRGEIATELGLSVNTVRTHIQHVLRKLGVHTTLGAVAMVLQERATASERELSTGGDCAYLSPVAPAQRPGPPSSA
jgi:two-component system nitrate/nitrite response regulator NarL